MIDASIISVPALKSLQSRGGVVLLDARTSRAAYDNAHLIGARHASLDCHLSSASDPGFDAAAGGRHPLPPLGRWLQTLGEWGIGPDSDVVVYDDQSGANAASRVWWMLRAIGHQRVAVLDAGYSPEAIAAIGITTDIPANLGGRAYPLSVGSWQWPTVTIQDVDQLRNDSTWKVLDVRSAPRFRGELEPIDPVAGHIPGAVNLPFTQNLEGASFRSAEELRDEYVRLLAGTDPSHLIVHCGSGVTACHTLLALDLAGLHGAALFVGSWSEWCRSPRPRDPLQSSHGK